MVRAKQATALAMVGATLGRGLVGPGKLTMIGAISGKSGFFRKMVGIGQKWAEKPWLLGRMCCSVMQGDRLEGAAQVAVS